MMTLSECLQLLHSYIGTDCDKQDYLFFLQTLIMREPITVEEQQADEENKYYPYIGSMNERGETVQLMPGT